jgi:two-component system phosphate regulon sensor histidine kinase PhoR
MMGELNAKQLEALATIIGATDRMNELISTLLNITRIESGTISVSPEPLELYDVLGAVLSELSLMAEAKAINLTLERSKPDRLSITCDALILREIVTNAIKYTPKGGRVTLKLSSRRAAVQIMVSDSGWGIPLYSQDQIFSKFFRAHNIVKRETTGTGLGLYMVKGLLDAIGGQIRFDSKEGEGTTFYIILPRRPPAVKKAT